MSVEATMNEIIKKIIENRRDKLESLKVRQKEFISMRQNLKILRERGAQAAQDADFTQLFESNPGLKEWLEHSQQLEESCNAYDVALKELDHLIDRFSRESINIAVAGDSRAGKSRFLQTVTGLDNQSIPSFAGSFCTGVSSVIENSDQEESVRGVFTFKTEDELRKEINEKLEKMTGGKLYLHTLDDVCNMTEAKIRNALTKSSEEGNISDFIKMYVQNFKEWEPFVRLNEKADKMMETYDLRPGRAGMREYICQTPSEIQKYVAKHDGGTEEERGTNCTYLYRYIAVKTAVIYTRFRLTGVNQIRLVDTVGLRDTAVGTTQKMYEAIDRDSDAVLYFFRPEVNEGGAIDDRTYNILNEELYPRYHDKNMQWWMGVLINHVKSSPNTMDNLSECKSFLESFILKAPGMARNVVFKEIIDVSDPKQVQERCIIPLLESISEHLGEIDRRIEENTREKIRIANKCFERLKKGFDEIHIPMSRDIIDSQFHEIFRQFISSTYQLIDTYDKKDLKDTFLEESLNQVLKLTEEDSEQSVYSICSSLDYTVASGSKRIRAFGEVQRMVRNIATRKTEKLDKAEKEFKTKLAEQFLQMFRFDKERCPQADSDTFFLDMAKQLFGSKKDLCMLRDIFLSVHDFHLNETCGLTKLLFHENVECYLTCDDNTTIQNHDTAVQNMDRNTFEESKKLVAEVPKLTTRKKDLSDDKSAQHNENMVIPRKKDLADDKSAQHNENYLQQDDALVGELIDKLNQFVKGIKESPFYSLGQIEPLSRQIASEIRYFLRFFDICYHREWASVLNQQLKEGYIFTQERQSMDNLSEKYETFKSMLDKAVVKVEVPQNI